MEPEHHQLQQIKQSPHKRERCEVLDPGEFQGFVNWWAVVDGFERRDAEGELDGERGTYTRDPQGWRDGGTLCAHITS